MRHLRHSLCATVAAVFFVGGPAFAADGFQLNVNYGPGMPVGSEARTAFQAAADAWAAKITNPVTININADLGSTDQEGNPFGQNVIGSTSIASYGVNASDINLNYDAVRNAMAARAVRPGDAILAALPTSAQVRANVPANATFDNTSLGILRSNQKALGLLTPANPTYSLADGFISFNSAFSFDYNRADGVTSTKMDFQTVATHEIGHLLGFLSDVDDFDSNTALASDNLTTLDLFRFGQAPTNPLDFATFARAASGRSLRHQRHGEQLRHVHRHLPRRRQPGQPLEGRHLQQPAVHRDHGPEDQLRPDRRSDRCGHSAWS